MGALTQKTIRGSLLRWLLIPAWVLGGLGLLASLLMHNLTHRNHLVEHAHDELCRIGRMYQPDAPLQQSLSRMELASTLFSTATSHGHPHFRFNTLPTLLSVGGPPIPVPEDAWRYQQDGCEVRVHTIWDQGSRQQVTSLLITPERAGDKRMLVQSVHFAPVINWRVLDLGLQMAISTVVVAIVFSLIVLLGVRRGLQPLANLVTAIRQLDSSKPGPIHVDKPPREIRYLEDTLNQQLQRIGDHVQRERQFLNDAAHQLRTPIAGIMNQAELALDDTDAQQVRQRLQHILQAAERGATLIRQLLMLSRGYENGSLGAVPFDLPQLAREVALQWAGPAADAGIEISYEGEEQGLMAGNPELIREALGNLLDNVIKHAQHATEAIVSVHADSQQGRCMLVLQVQDNGEGVTPEQLQHLFERFWTCDDNQGNGIGLALVREIAQAHQGRVEAVLRQPRGLLVRMCLPAAVA